MSGFQPSFNISIQKYSVNEKVIEERDSSSPEFILHMVPSIYTYELTWNSPNYSLKEPSFRAFHNYNTQAAKIE